jgi:hypothetical protein
MRNFLLGTMCFAMLISCQNEQHPEQHVAGEATKSAGPVEFADQKYIDMGKKAFDQFASGDINSWVNNFTDNAIYRWSSGDSLAGKAAITGYWKERRMNVIDSINFSNDIWLPVTVNQPQSGEAKGTWLLNWHQVNVKFKNGQRLSFWVHTDMHYNSANQIDECIQYIDRAPINAALAKKK